MRATSKEYAAALFSLARESHSEKETLEELRFIESVFEDAPGYAEFLASPAIPRSERIESVERAFEGQLSEYVMSFLSLLCEHGCAELLPGCVSEYEKLYNQSAGLAKAEVVSAVMMNDDQKHRLRDKLETLSGCKLRLRIDGSLRNKLKNIRKVMGE